MRQDDRAALPDARCSRDFRSASLSSCRAQPLTEDEAARPRKTRGFPDSDYVPPDDGCPFDMDFSTTEPRNPAIRSQARILLHEQSSNAQNDNRFRLTLGSPGNAI
jgi:hypothetical protein